MRRRSPRPNLRQPATGGETSMPESVYKVIELVGTSEESWEKAASAAVEQASGSLRDLRIAEVVELDLQIEDGLVKTYRAKVKVSFKLRPGHDETSLRLVIAAELPSVGQLSYCRGPRSPVQPVPPSPPRQRHQSLHGPFFLFGTSEVASVYAFIPRCRVRGGLTLNIPERHRLGPRPGRQPPVGLCGRPPPTPTVAEAIC